MSNRKYRKIINDRGDFDEFRDDENCNLKREIKCNEDRGMDRWNRNEAFKRGLENSGSDSSTSGSKVMDLCNSPLRRRTIVSTLPRSPPDANQHVDYHVQSENPQELNAKWVSPPVRKARSTVHDILSRCPESSFDLDCGSSVISLDYGLVTPKKKWCSPPQRIERAQNREWSSPHRVIDRPNPENSPGNWISMKESCSTFQRSPAIGIKSQTVEPVNLIPKEQQPRSVSQATYVVPEKVSTVNPQTETYSQPIRKISVLGDYEPEKHLVSTKKRSASSTEILDYSLIPSNDKIKRIVDSDGHVIKISLLDDYEAPVFGKTHEKVSEPAEKGIEGGEKSSKGSINVKKKAIITKSVKKSTSLVSKVPSSKKEEEKEEGPSARKQSSESDLTKSKSKESKIGKEETEKDEENPEEAESNTQKIIKDLEKILRESKENETDKTDVKSKIKSKPKKKPPPKFVEEKPFEILEKRKRNVDPEAVQKYIKDQKQRRIEQVKMEKKTKVAEIEAKKKKLEELRIKTLKLAAQSKKKKAPQSTISVIEQGTEDEVTMSLGLKQVKPKVSYNESILNLKKKLQQPKPQPIQIEEETIKELEEKSEEGKEEEEEEEKTLQNVEPPPLEPVEEEPVVEELKKPEDTVELKKANDLNETLKKLAETLQEKIREREKHMRSKSVSVASKPPSQVPSQESVKTTKSAPEGNRQLVAVDLETIHSLKEDIKKISENFKVLHEIILEKTDLQEKTPPKEIVKVVEEEPEKSFWVEPKAKEMKSLPDWFQTVVPRPHPYNVYTAFRHKMNLKTPSITSQESSTFTEPLSNKYKSDFEALSMPSDRLRSGENAVRSYKSTTEGSYYSMKNDSGSEFSSSILDSDKQSTEITKREFFREETKTNNSQTSSILTEITSRSIRLGSSKALDSLSSKSIASKFSSDKENLVLVTPDIKLISNDLHQEKLNNHSKNLNNMLKSAKNSDAVGKEDLNNSDARSNKEKSDSTITEIIDNLSENDKSVKSLKAVNEKPQNTVQRIEEVHIRRSFFHPETLHLQFQAELTLLETFQHSLSHFLETERQKTLTEVNKIVYEKSSNTEKFTPKEDQAVQTTFTTDASDKASSETDSVKTEIVISQDEESVKTIKSSKKKTSSFSSGSSVSRKSFGEKDIFQKETETDFSNGHSGISFQMLNRMMKDEELRSEHQLALIRLREKTLNEKVKAELTFLEMKKRALKEKGGDEEHNISAIKKKQRGILLKYQSEKEEIERLKKMHKIASEERKIMIKQQKQLQQMQLSTKDMIIKLKKREKSPHKRTPLKPKALKLSDSQSSIQEDIPTMSDSVLTESIYESTRHSTDMDLSSGEEIDFSRRSTKFSECRKSISFENLKPKKSLVDFDKYPRKKHSVEELLSWTKRLEEKESRLKELENQAVNSARSKGVKSLKNVITSVKDRSTSPFQFSESIKTVSEISPTNLEGTDTKKSSTISEIIESQSKIDLTEKTVSVPEKPQSIISEDIPEQFSKKATTATTSRTTEYNSESFESPSSSETTKKKQMLRSQTTPEGSHKSISIKLALSPRLQSPRRRYSSGSDDSLNLSHTETASEQSDLETRIATLHEQLRKRKLEAERLRKEQKKAQRERLKVKEQSLLKQIQAYDAYIQKKKQELEQEFEHSNQIVMKPLIKQPKVAEKSSLKRQEPLPLTENLITKPVIKIKEDITLPEKAIESDNEITEQIIKQDTSESIKEQLKDTSESVKEQLKDVSESIKEELKDSSESITEQIKDISSSSKTKETSEKLTQSVIEKSFVESLKEECTESVKDQSKDVTESIQEQSAKEESEITKNEIESKVEELEEEESKALQSTPETTGKDVSESIKSTSVSESVITEQEEVDGSQSESEEQSISVKTTLHSPEKPESEKNETETSRSKQTIDDEAYQFDSFESDYEEKVVSKTSESLKQSESGEILSEILEEEREDEETKKESLVEEKEIGVESEKEEKVEKMSVMADAITDKMLLELLQESVHTFACKKQEEEKKVAEESKITLEALSSFLAKKIISEAVDDMLRIYNKKALTTIVEEDSREVEKETSSVRKRISEIMSQTGGVRDQKRPQDLMITTYDVSPTGSPPGEISDDAKREEFLQSLVQPRKDDVLDDVYPEGEGSQENKQETFGQEWFDDDYGLSRTRREAEELRLQQLQIEQEIQQLQAQQEQVPYFYLREIPNKPPPPYTPPGKPVAEVPTSESDIIAITSTAVRILTDEMMKGKRVVDVEPSPEYYGNVVSEHIKTYKLFLFDLAKHIISNVLEQQESKVEVLPWLRTRERLSKYKYKKIERTSECLKNFVEKQVLILFGFGKKVGKESLIVRWIKKRRDHMDEILVGESQEEESQWTQYDEDQVAVKNEVTVAILDSLLEDTAQVVNAIFSKKLQKTNKL